MTLCRYLGVEEGSLDDIVHPLSISGSENGHEQY